MPLDLMKVVNKERTSTRTFFHIRYLEDVAQLHRLPSRARENGSLICVHIFHWWPIHCCGLWNLHHRSVLQFGEDDYKYNWMRDKSFLFDGHANFQTFPELPIELFIFRVSLLLLWQHQPILGSRSQHPWHSDFRFDVFDHHCLFDGREKKVKL